MPRAEKSSGDDRPVAGTGDHFGRPGATMRGADLLDEYLRRTGTGDRAAFRALHALLSPYVRDCAACLFGPRRADIITDAVFVDVWRLAHQYRPGGEGVHAWVLNIAGTHTVSRYQPDTSARAA